MQTSVVDGSREDWVLFCNGTSVHFRLALGRWNFLGVVLDTKENTISVRVNDQPIGSIVTSRECNFGSSPLTLGSHADINSRVFRGDVDKLIVLRN